MSSKVVDFRDSVIDRRFENDPDISESIRLADIVVRYLGGYTDQSLIEGAIHRSLKSRYQKELSWTHFSYCYLGNNIDQFSEDAPIIEDLFQIRVSHAISIHEITGLNFSILLPYKFFDFDCLSKTEQKRINNLTIGHPEKAKKRNTDLKILPEYIDQYVCCGIEDLHSVIMKLNEDGEVNEIILPEDSKFSDFNFDNGFLYADCRLSKTARLVFTQKVDTYRSEIIAGQFLSLSNFNDSDLVERLSKDLNEDLSEDLSEFIGQSDLEDLYNIITDAGLDKTSIDIRNHQKFINLFPDYETYESQCIEIDNREYFTEVGFKNEDLNSELLLLVNQAILNSHNNETITNPDDSLTCLIHNGKFRQARDLSFFYERYDFSHKCAKLVLEETREADDIYRISLNYYFGWGTNINLKLSAKYLMQAINLDHSPAIQFYFGGNRPERFKKYLDIKDTMKIIKNSKTISAKAYNGVHLLLGLHTRKNVPRGLKLIQDASDGDHPLALHAQAYLNIRNKDNPNIKLAKKLIKKASTSGYENYSGNFSRECLEDFSELIKEIQFNEDSFNSELETLLFINWNT